MNTCHLNFCDLSSEIATHLVDLCATKLTSLPKEEVKEIYQTWSKGFDNDGSDLYIGRSSDIIPKDFAHAHDAVRLGIDFPTWLNFTKSQKRKKIMIVGIDPLRDSDRPGEVQLGTPYAFHRRRMRTGRTKQYWAFIEDVAKAHSVYLTDIYKLFYLSPSKSIRSYRDRSFTAQPIHREILNREIEIIEPDLIITMGREASQFILERGLGALSKHKISQSDLRKGDGPQVIPMIHLSATTRSNHLKAFIQNNMENPDWNTGFGHLYAQIVNAHLESTAGAPGNSPDATKVHAYEDTI